MSISKAPPIHPGEILKELYLAPLNMTPYSLARQLRVPRTRIERIVGEKVGISADTALRLAKFFQTTPEFWLNLQAGYDLKRESSVLEAELAQIPAFKAA